MTLDRTSNNGQQTPFVPRRLRGTLAVALGASTMVLVGCASTEPDDVTGLRDRLDEEQTRVSQLQDSNQNLEAQLSKAEAMLASSDSGDNAGSLLPPGAKAGECFARVYVEPEYKESTRNIVASEAGESVEVIPAKFGMSEEQVLVREASTEIKVVPAKYRMVNEKVLVREAREEAVPVPAKYEDVTERVKVSDAYSYWKPGTGAIERIDSMTGEIMCLIEVPAKYQTVTKQKLVQAASTQSRSLPAEYRTIEKRVVVEPAKTVEVPIPAVYRTVKVRKMTQPPTERKTAIPARYATVTERELVTDGGMEWRPILCETNTTPGIVRRIQSALRTAGHNPGPIDGVLGRETMGAVSSYQTSKGQPAGKLTMETLRSLGVSS